MSSHLIVSEVIVITLANAEPKHADISNYLGVSITAKGINSKLMHRSGIDAAVKNVLYSKNKLQREYPPTIMRKVFHSSVYHIMEYRLELQHLSKMERSK